METTTHYRPAYTPRRHEIDFELAWQNRMALEARQAMELRQARRRQWLRQRAGISAAAAFIGWAWALLLPSDFPRGTIREIGHYLATVFGGSELSFLASAGGALAEIGVALILVSLPQAWLRGLGIGLFLAVAFGLALPLGPYLGELFQANQEPALALVLIVWLVSLPLLVAQIWRDPWRDRLGLGWARLRSPVVLSLAKLRLRQARERDWVRS